MPLVVVSAHYIDMLGNLFNQKKTVDVVENPSQDTSQISMTASSPIQSDQVIAAQQNSQTVIPQSDTTQPVVGSSIDPVKRQDIWITVHYKR